MGRDDKIVKPPSFALLATEGRGLLDIPALFAAAPFLLTEARNDGSLVLLASFTVKPAVAARPSS